jgi:ribose transport system permease protein
MKKNKIVKFMSENIWSWALLGSILMWLIICVISGKFSIESFHANAYTAAFIALVSIAQMLVVTTGHGAMDLSVPGMITLAAFLQMTIINGVSSHVPLGIFAVILAGILVGLINGSCVVFLKIPPMIATLAVNYIITSVSLTINKNNGLQNLVQAEPLVALARGKLFGIYCILYLAAIIGVLIWFLLKKTTYGKALLATGQNDIAAHYAGISTTKIKLLTYMISSVLCALAGMLISVRVGGAFLGMGDDYLMLTVGSVVLGGTLMSGGKSSVAGTMAGALFLTIVVTVMQIAKFAGGMQNFVEGAIIILIILIATPSRKKSIHI